MYSIYITSFFPTFVLELCTSIHYNKYPLYGNQKIQTGILFTEKLRTTY